MKQEIRVGDRVRHKALRYEGDVLELWEERAKLQLHDSAICWERLSSLEIVAPEDKRREFLGKLGALLREYDARIEPEFNISADIASVNIIVGGEYVVESDRPITADNMIDPKELRIGSHVLCNGKWERVRGLDEDNGLIIRFPAEYVLASDVEPIPITAGVLASVGFVVDGKHCTDNKVTFVSGKQWDAYITYNTHTKMYIAHFGFFDVVKVKYLHEVEMMWYMVYGKELIEDD